MRNIDSILADIREANDQELSQIVQAVLGRYTILFPEDEVFFLSVPLNNRAERAAILKHTADLIEQQK